MDIATFRLGQKIAVVPICAVDRNRWEARCAEQPGDCNCFLLQRSPNGMRIGEPLSAWVLNIDLENRWIEVTDSDFGFMPISDRMRSRYVSSLRTVLAAVSDGVRDEQCAAALSEVKGMYSRCARRDQWDWHAVSLALGEPSREDARSFAESLGEAAKHLRAGQAEQFENELFVLVDRGMVGQLQHALRSISDICPTLPRASILRPRRKQPKVAEGNETKVVSSYCKVTVKPAVGACGGFVLAFGAPTYG